MESEFGRSTGAAGQSTWKNGLSRTKYRWVSGKVPVAGQSTGAVDREAQVAYREPGLPCFRGLQIYEVSC